MSTGTAQREDTRNEPVVAAKMAVIGEGRTLATGVTFYVVPSRTEVGKLYLVYRLKTRLECTCLAGKYHPETPCIHRQAVRDFLLDRMSGDSRERAHPGDTAPLRRSQEPFSLLKR